MSAPVRIVDANGLTRLVGTDADGGASGGSPLISQIFTAAQIAAAWDTDYFQSARAVTGVSPGDLVQCVWVDANSLDQGVDLDTFASYLPGETTAQVSDNGNALSGVIGARGSEGTYAHTVTVALNYGVINAGSQAYAVFNGDGAPTTGTLTLKLLLATA